MHLDFRGAFSFSPSKTTADRNFLDNRKNRGMMKPRKEEFYEISSDSEPGRRRIFHRGLIFAGFGPIVAGIVYAVLQGTSPDFSLPEGRSASPLFPHIFWHFCRQERRSSTKLKPGHCPNLCFAASPRCTPPTWGVI